MNEKRRVFACVDSRRKGNRPAVVPGLGARNSHVCGDNEFTCVDGLIKATKTYAATAMGRDGVDEV